MRFYKYFNRLKKYFSSVFKKHQDDDWPINVAIPDKPNYEMIEYMRQRVLMAKQFDEELKIKNGYYNNLWKNF